jgi:hypothetical protein
MSGNFGVPADAVAPALREARDERDALFDARSTCFYARRGGRTGRVRRVPRRQGRHCRPDPIHPTCDELPHPPRRYVAGPAVRAAVHQQRSQGTSSVFNNAQFGSRWLITLRGALHHPDPRPHQTNPVKSMLLVTRALP